MSNYSIMSVKDMIEMAFGDPRIDVVNFKLLQTILYLLARQLRLLGRRVEVNVEHPFMSPPRSTIIVTELKMQAAGPKKPKRAKLSETDSTDITGEKTPQKKTSKSIGGGQESTKGDSKKTITEATKRVTDPRQDGVEQKRGVPDPRQGGTETRSRETDAKKTLVDQRRAVSVARYDGKSQRADSREEAEKSPTPMASLDSIEMQYEKLLVVERTSSEETRIGVEDPRSTLKTRRLSVVTQDQFQALVEKVRELQSQFGGVPSAKFPDNIELMQQLRRGASLTDAMAALQLSARLEAAEKTLGQMLSLLTTIAGGTPGIDAATTEALKRATLKARETAYGDKQLTEQFRAKDRDKSPTLKPAAVHPTALKTISEETKQPSTYTYTQSAAGRPESVLEEPVIKFSDLNHALEKIQGEILTEVRTLNNANTESAANALRFTRKLDSKIEALTQLGPKMNDLEKLVTNYAEQINALDTGLSAQMTDYHENLNQMQHDLEIALETMAEALANTGSDTEIVAELNTKLGFVQEDIDRAAIKQKELMEMQNGLHIELRSIWQEIEVLREVKPDRDEVADALRDKAGLKALNGLVSHNHFDAVRGDFQKSVAAAYDKFNNQEIVWQKAIDDIFRELSEKADYVQLHSLSNDIDNKFKMLNSRAQFIMDILGEPVAAATTKKLFRDSACLSCSTPAHMEPMESETIPKLPEFPKSAQKGVDTERTSKPAQDNVCIPGRPVPHAIDPRSEFCKRYCGGGAVGRPIKKNEAIRYVSSTLKTTSIGTDGKTYMTEEPCQPCVPCNQPRSETIQPLETDKAPKLKEELVSDVTAPSDFFMQEVSGLEQKTETRNGVSVTPTLPLDDD
ncbi:PREDICTED: golgin subfamily B member 1-like isoform X2 [Papilio polytes]|uniref:golgin subfamily B member 1-like isoform X2 n=1 Tax=Papilio polytes TaxID=76194 RepID=UPI0006767D68|nr:PREDICTED: golgin subfamily B member 1-like isoform X2 [Papilio polytes]